MNHISKKIIQKLDELVGEHYSETLFQKEDEENIGGLIWVIKPFVQKEITKIIKEEFKHWDKIVRQSIKAITRLRVISYNAIVLLEEQGNLDLKELGITKKEYKEIMEVQDA